VRFCLNYVPLFPAEVNRAWWRACENAGIERIGIGDSPALARELYVTLAACLLDTERLAVMPSVTNPVTRDPAVTAAALYSLADLAPGRLSALGLGTGDSALWGTGLKVAAVTRLREYISAIRGLLQGEEVSYMGRSFRAEWADPNALLRLPIAVACAGPKVLRMAAQTADTLIISMGYGDENLDYVRETITAACHEVGRDPNDLEIWWNAAVHVAESSEAALAAGVQLGASWLTAGGFEGKQIPIELQAPLHEFTRDARDLAFMYKTPDRNRILAERAQSLGIYDWLLERSPRLWGTPTEIAGRLRELRERGLNNWIFNLGGVGIDRLALVDVLAHEIIPSLG
jgi:5,10-methylenetetrahydromethanopterin reductase